MKKLYENLHSVVAKNEEETPPRIWGRLMLRGGLSTPGFWLQIEVLTVGINF